MKVIGPVRALKGCFGRPFSHSRFSRVGIVTAKIAAVVILVLILVLVLVGLVLVVLIMVLVLICSWSRCFSATPPRPTASTPAACAGPA
jgi:hypothetical protein